VVLSPPRDRDGSFEPKLIPKGEKYFTGFNNNILAQLRR
jgi:transposase-like protein